jgi:hypothetical protein
MPHDLMAALLTDMLDHCCGLLGADEIDRFNDGYQRYSIDAHCVSFTINARRDSSKDFGDPSAWDIRDWSKEDC